MSVLVIAEPGATAQGDHATMLKLIDVAHQCGANVYKATWICDLPLMMRRRNFVEGTEEWERFARIYGWHVWPLAWHQEFRDRCYALGMEYACTVHTPDAVKFAAPFVDYLKISGFESGDKQMRTAYNAYRRVRKPLIIASIPGGAKRSNWAQKQLHCVQAYPCDIEAIELACIRDKYQGDGEWERGFDGLSDHSRHLLTGAIAVACGAQVIETHYRLDDCDPENPDYAVAFTPAEFAHYIQNIRDAERMLGTGVKQMQPCEVPLLRYRVHP